jgi:hypothetical protein
VACSPLDFKTALFKIFEFCEKYVLMQSGKSIAAFFIRLAFKLYAHRMKA